MQIKKINFIIKNFKPKKTKVILLLSTIIALSELLGLGILIPLMQKILNTSENSNMNFLKIIYNLNFEALLILIFFVYLIKNLLILIINSYFNQFISKFRSFLSIKLFSNIINKDLKYHLKRNTSEFIHAAIDDPNIFVSFVLKSYLQIISEFLILLFICFSLIIIEPNGSAVTFVVLVFFIFLYMISTQKFSKNLGILKRVNDERRLFSLKEAFNSVKEIKFFKIEDFIIKNFSKFNDESSKSFRKHSTITVLPKLYFETVAVILILLLVYYAKIKFSIGNEMLFKVAIFGLASVKIIPSLNKLSILYQNIKFGDAVTTKIYNYIKMNYLFSTMEKEQNMNKFNYKNFNFQSLEAKNLTFMYEENQDYIFKNLNFSIKKNKHVRIDGETGSGKSTLINIILGLLKPSKGTILLNGKEINPEMIDLKEFIGYVPQTIYILNDTIENNILFGREKNLNHKENLKYLIKIFGLSEGYEKNYITENGKNLSGGQKQILGIIRALYNNPKILIMDEATNSLDQNNENNVFDILKNNFNEITIVGVTHNSKIHGLFEELIHLR